MSDLELSMHADGFNNVIRKMADRSSKTLEAGPWKKLGPLRLKFDGARGHAEVSNSPFRVIDPSVGGPRGQIKELDWKWDRLAVSLGVDIPEITIGGWCLLKIPIKGCVLRAPKLTVFSNDPDLSIQINLAGLRHEISSAFNIDVKNNRSDKKYELYLKPEMPLDVDFIDVADIAGDLLDRVIDLIVNKLLGFLPEWARSIVNAVLGGIAKLVREILDWTDDLVEWISEKVGVSLGLFNLLASALIELFYKPDPIFEIDNPYQVLPKQDGEPAVTLNITSIRATFDVNEQSFKIGLAV